MNPYTLTLNKFGGVVVVFDHEVQPHAGVEYGPDTGHTVQL